MASNDGYVYLVQLPSSGAYKIGRTKRIKLRLRELRSGCGENLRLLHTIAVEDSIRTERALHIFFLHRRIEGEWFRLTDDDIEKITRMSGDDDIMCLCSERVAKTLQIDGKAKRHVFAISDTKTSREFSERCKRNGLKVSYVLERFMKLYIAGKLDKIMYEEE